MADQEGLLKAVLGELLAPVFCAEFDPGRCRLKLHLAAGYDTARLKSQAEWAIRDLAVARQVRVSVSSHKVRQLAFPKTLEHWLKRFSTGQVVHDPTMIVTRARRLLLAAKMCRSKFGRLVDGLYLDPARRTLFVLYHGSKTTPSQKSDLLLLLAAAVNEGSKTPPFQNHEANPLPIHVQLVSSLPLRKLVPVDTKSAGRSRKLRRLIRRWFAPGAVALAAATAAVPAAAHVDAAVFADRGSSASVLGSRATNTPYGILFGLSVFSDGLRHHGTDPFASSGLEMYFGEASDSLSSNLIVVAQDQKKRRRRPREPDEVGQVGGEGGGAAGGPGS